ncbi:DUF2863 family protein [Uliginosibacterium paludis]|uniref:DUF2863 family protein n=1 Tax=Uliginosibacterium paludis TaxID=1615952 RepID=A0ABV2CLN4_9RHOO
MKPSRNRRASTQPPEAETLQKLAAGLAESGCRAEDAFWEKHLEEALDAVFAEGDENVLVNALDGLYEKQQRAYEVLADSIESRAEEAGVLLLAAPVLAWSRFEIPSGRIPAAILKDLSVHLRAHVLAEGVQLGIADMLFSPDQLPQGFCETAGFTRAIAAAAEADGVMKVDEKSLPETGRFLSDVRYILAAVKAGKAQPIFRWQEADGSRAHALAQWKQQGGACLAPMLPGCAIEPELPDAFFAACRQSDRASRPFSIMASTAFLSTTLDVEPEKLRAVVAVFRDQQVEELRIGFTLAERSEVVHGVVWPLLGPDEEAAEAFVQIEASLRQVGIRIIEQLDQRFPLEYCDDCGAPMYPSPEGEAMHAELPEDRAGQMPRHLH